MDTKDYGTCTACGAFVTRGRAPFQSADRLYENRPNGAFCPAADGEPHTLEPKRTNHGPRTYVIGVPLALTVDDYGRVTLDVDLAEAAGRDLEPCDEGQPERTLLVDSEVLSEAVARIGNCLTVTIHPTVPTA